MNTVYKSGMWKVEVRVQTAQSGDKQVWVPSFVMTLPVESLNAHEWTAHSGLETEDKALHKARVWAGEVLCAHSVYLHRCAGKASDLSRQLYEDAQKGAS